MTRIAFYPGTFDPVTNGHVDVLNGALALADKVVVGIGINSAKSPLFSLAERKAMVAGMIRDLGRAEAKRASVVTFDGLADREGKIVFCTSHVYGEDVMEAVLADSHISYYSVREIPADLERAGRKLVEGFKVRERFFHFEFFRRKDGTLYALEVNIRPPGGFTMDMFNFACDIDMYSVWARMMAGEKIKLDYQRKYHCCYAGRKYRLNYRYSHEELLGLLGPKIVLHTELPPVLARAMGDCGYLVRAADKASILEAVKLIQTER